MTAQLSANTTQFADASSHLSSQAHQIARVSSQIEKSMRTQVTRTGAIHAAISELHHTVGVAADVAVGFGKRSWQQQQNPG